MARKTSGSESLGEIEQLAQDSKAGKGGWQQAIADMRAMAADREDKGYEVLTIPAGDTTPIAPADSDRNDFGLSFIVPNDKGEQFADLHDKCTFEEAAVYQTSIDGHIYMVMEYNDLDSDVVIFIAGAYRMRQAVELVRAATNKGMMNTYIKTLDHTILGEFEHDDVSMFFPNPDEFLAFEV